MVHDLAPPWLDAQYFDSDYVTPVHGGKFLLGLERQKKRYIRWLNAAPSHAAREIAANLGSCSALTPCGDGVCPMCGLAQNQWFRDEAHRLFDGKQLTTFSTVQLSDKRSLPSRLSHLNIAEQLLLLNQALQDAGLSTTPFFGAFDFSYNTYSNGAESWSCHSVLLTCDRDSRTISRLLNSVIGKSKHVPIPVKTLIINRTPDRVFSYALKSVFFRRIAATSRGHQRHVSSKMITPSDPLFDELAIALHRFGRTNRLIARNVDIITGQ